MTQPHHRQPELADAPVGVLLMAYGTPETPDDVEAYFTHIRGGRKPSPESVAHLRERYAVVGGRTPLLDITRAVERKLEDALGGDGGGARHRVYAGMKHWHPYIGDVLPIMMRDGVRRVIAVALAPHYSRMSVGGYRKAVEDAQAALGHPFAVTFVDSWHAQPEFIDMMVELVRAGLTQFPPDERGRVVTVFSAHSLPEKIRQWGDPYEAQLLESSRLVAERLDLRDWRFAWQSAGQTGEPWIGPDITEYLETLAAEGATRVLQVPIGFVCDHLEVLYDVDHEAKQKAASLGIVLERTQMPNDRPAFIRTLAAVVREAERVGGGVADGPRAGRRAEVEA